MTYSQKNMKFETNGPILSLECTEIEALFSSKEGTGSRRARRFSPVAVVFSSFWHDARASVVGPRHGGPFRVRRRGVARAPVPVRILAQVWLGFGELCIAQMCQELSRVENIRKLLLVVACSSVLLASPFCDRWGMITILPFLDCEAQLLTLWAQKRTTGLAPSNNDTM